MKSLSSVLDRFSEALWAREILPSFLEASDRRSFPVTTTLSVPSTPKPQPAARSPQPAARSPQPAARSPHLLNRLVRLC